MLGVVTVNNNYISLQVYMVAILQNCSNKHYNKKQRQENLSNIAVPYNYTPDDQVLNWDPFGSTKFVTHYHPCTVRVVFLS
jgi:hypothetical protein